MSKKIKVLRTIESFYPYMSGPANQVYRISKELESRGIKSPILTSRYKAEKSPAHEKKNGVEVFRFPIKWKFMKYFVTPDIKNMFTDSDKFFDFDVVHAHSYRGYQTEIAYKMAKKRGKPFVISTHGSLLGYSQHLKGFAKLPYIFYDIIGGKKIILNADAVIVNSKKEYSDALKYGVSKKKLYTLPVGIDVSEYKQLKKTGNPLTVLFVGGISRNRHVEPIIRAAAIFKKKKTFSGKIRFIIVGGEVKSSDTSKSGYLDELKKLADDLGVSDIVTFTGEKRGKTLKKIYRTSDIFVYTSRSENFGQTIIEAGAAGLPLICTRVGIAPEIIENGKNGFLVKPDAKEIADRIFSLTDYKKRDRFGRIMRETVRKRFDWQEIMKSYLQIYNSVIKRKKV